MILKAIKDLEEYKSTIKEIHIKNKLTWYRGQSNSIYRLEPSSFRKMKPWEEIDIPRSGRNNFAIPNEKAEFENFKKQYLELYPKRPDITDFEILYIMQHYGVPTRLLDFTSHSLVALYFAVTGDLSPSYPRMNPELTVEESIDEFFEKEGFTDNGSAVYCINPNKVNDLSLAHASVINADIYNLSDFKDVFHPFCLETSFNEKRINAQSGKFMYFGQFIHPIDYYDVIRDDLCKIFIPKAFRNSIKIELKEKENISHRTMFPDIEGLVKETKENINEQFRAFCLEHNIK